MIGQNVTASPRRCSGWFTSSYSNGSGSCVEVNIGDRGVLVRDSKDQRADRHVVEISSAAWNSFLEHIC